MRWVEQFNPAPGQPFSVQLLALESDEERQLVREALEELRRRCEAPGGDMFGKAAKIRRVDKMLLEL